MRSRYTPLLIGALAVTACSDSTSPPATTQLAPMATASVSQTEEAVPNEYIVALRPGANVRAEASRARAAGAVVMDTWEAGFRGFSVRVSGAALNAVRASRAIDFVQPNYILHIDAAQPCAPYTTCSWGLDRIDEANLPLDGSYNMPAQVPNQGAGVHAYSIDTGIRITHTDFGGRASYGINAVTPANPPDDNNGHGTHTSGTIGGTSYGVAKQVKLVAVKVCTGFGTCPTNAIITGVNWVTTNAIHPAVANMSLGGGANAAIDAAVTSSIASGVVYAIAAGNSNANACNTSPAWASLSLTRITMRVAST